MSNNRKYTRGAWLLSEYVRRQGMLEQDLAPALGVSPQRVSNYLTGKGRPSLERAVQIEKLFGVPVSAWAQEQRMSREMVQRIMMVEQAATV